MALIDYTSSFEDSLIAQGKEGKVLIIRHLDHPIKRANGKRVSYELEYRDLSTTCEDENDQAWACCVCQEFTYWSKKELVESGIFTNLGAKVHKSDINLFEQFTLY